MPDLTTTDPKATDHTVTDPKATGLTATDPKATDHTATDPKATDPGTADPGTADPVTRSRPRTSAQRRARHAAADPPVVAAPPRGRSRPPRPRLTWPARAVAALAVVSLGAAAWFGLSWWRAAHSDTVSYAQAREDVLRDAGQAAINLNTLQAADPAAVKAQFQTMEAATTGDLLQELQRNEDSYAKAVADGKSKTTATVADAAVAELDARAGSARVLVAVDVLVTPAQGDPQTKRQRLQLEMTRVGGVWKAGKLGPVGMSAPAGATG